MGMEEWLGNLFACREMGLMGHAQEPETHNLGLGWIYYGLVRTHKPQTVVSIGSYRGFVPIVLRKAQLDNAYGDLHFIDPSLVDPFWTKPECVTAHFESYGAPGIRHHKLTTQEFVETEEYRQLTKVDLLYVDGFHTAEQARFDHEAFLPLMPEGSYTVFHDAVRERRSRIYGEDKAYVHTVYQYIAELESDPRFEVLNFPMGDGLAIVRHKTGATS